MATPWNLTHNFNAHLKKFQCTAIPHNRETMATKLSRGNGNLTSDENYAFFQLIGDKCQSLCSTLAQVYEQDGAMKSRWIKKYSGLLCFIKDNGKRSYYMRMYCLMLHKMVWEQEIYNELIIDKTRPFLLEFEGQVCRWKVLRLNDSLLMMMELKNWIF